MSLVLERVYAGYDGGTVLHGVSLVVAQAGVTAVVGHNGAGKSTLLHTIAGLHPISAGRVILQGHDLAELPAHRRNRLGMGYVPQGARVFASLTVDEHLTLSYRNTTADSHWTIDRIMDLLPTLRRRRHHRAGLLSGGEKQMLAIARSLLTQPRILLLDEPTEGLAPAVVEQFIELIRFLLDCGVTMLLATPQPDFAAAVTGRIAVLNSGRLTPYFGSDGDSVDITALRSALAPLAS